MTNKKYEFCLFLECVKFTDGVFLCNWYVFMSYNLKFSVCVTCHLH